MKAWPYSGPDDMGPRFPRRDEMSAKHTPGPWIAQIPNIGEDPFERDERGNQYWEIKPVEMLFDGRYLDVTAWTSEANARLISAAPELLEALIFCLEGLRTYAPEYMHGIPKNIYMSKASESIAKATGEAQ